MQAPRSSPVLPLRPLTLGELLDAAVALLRRHASPLLGVAAVLAAVEQTALYPLRVAAGVRPDNFLPYEDLAGEYWVMLCTGLATEAVILVLLGGVAGRAAAASLAGAPLSGRALLRARPGRLVALGVLALCVGVLAGLGAFAGLLPWLVVFGLLGLAGPALVVERAGPGRALLRSLRLSGRGGMRAGWVRLVGYLGWLAIRLALGWGGLALVEAVAGLPPGMWGTVLGWAAWVAVDALAYATLGCLDAVLHLETRMRAEGLDIAVSRAVRRGHPVATVLAVP